VESLSNPSRTMEVSVLTVIVISFLTLSVVSTPSLYIVSSVFAKNIAQSEERDGEENELHIIKNAMNSYTISSGASFIGAFETTYSITGRVSSMELSKDLITSTITEDFSHSPTIGYVNNTISTSPSPSQPGLPNPFATKAAIDEKVRHEIATSIGNASKSGSVQGEIKCIFGSSLDNFRCSFHRLLS
jgi:hypothetical protein